MNLFPLFRTFLVKALKIGKIPFLKFDYNGNEAPNGAPTLIEADFTRANAPEDGTKSGAITIDADGTFRELGLNEPRLTYPIGGKANGCQVYKFLPELKNKIIYSDNLTQIPVPWQHRGLNPTFNGATIKGRPASLLTEDTSTGSHDSRFFPAYTSGNNYSIILLLRPNGRTKIRVNANNTIGVWDIDLETQVVTRSGSGTEVNNELIDLGNNEFLFIGQATSGATSSDNTFIALKDNNGNLTYTGDGSSGLFVSSVTWTNGLNHNIIPTTGTALTRQKDEVPAFNISSQGLNVNSTLYFQFKPQFETAPDTGSMFGFQDGGSITNSLLIAGNSNLLRCIASNAGGSSTISFQPDLGFSKYAIRKNGEDVEFWINGFLVGTAVGFWPDALSEIIFQNSSAQGFEIKNEGWSVSTLSAEETEKICSWTTIAEMAADLNYITE